MRGAKVKADEATVRSLWFTEIPNDRLAEALGITHGGLETLRTRYGLPRRRHHAAKGNAAHKPDPTEDEIAERAAQVRAGWTAAEAERRWQHGSLRYRFPHYAYDGRNVAFSAMDG